MSTLSYVILYYALVTHFAGQAKAINRVIGSILVSAALISFYALLEKLGIDKSIWVQDVQNRVFSTLGQPNWLSAFLVAILPISLFRSINSSNTDQRLTYTLASLLYFAAIMCTKSQSGIGATFVILALFTVIASIQKQKTKYLFISIPLILLVLILKRDSVFRTLSSLNKINPFFSNAYTIITEENKTRIGGSDSMAIRRVVWQGAVELGLKYPLFGTGVETFGYSYYWVRPAVHNLTSEADFLYNKAHNEYLNFLATTGFVGLATYLFLIFSTLRLLIKKPAASSDLRLPLILGYLSILITNYFGFSVVNIALFFFLYPAMYISEQSLSQEKSFHHRLPTHIFQTIIICMAIYFAFGVRNYWLADINYTAGRTSLDENNTAIRLNPREPIYYSQLGSVEALVVTQIIAPQIKQMDASTPAEMKEKAKAYFEQFMSESIANHEKALSLNKYNLNLYKSKARTELVLATVDPTYNISAVKTLESAIQYSPNEASNYYNIGVIYATLAKANLSAKVLGVSTEQQKTFSEKARQSLQKAIELKPDYQAAKDQLQQLAK